MGVNSMFKRNNVTISKKIKELEKEKKQITEQIHYWDNVLQKEEYNEEDDEIDRTLQLKRREIKEAIDILKLKLELRRKEEGGK